MPDAPVMKLRAPDGSMQDYKFQESFVDHSEAYCCFESLKEGKYRDVEEPVHSAIEGFWAVYTLDVLKRGGKKG